MGRGSALAAMLCAQQAYKPVKSAVGRYVNQCTVKGGHHPRITQAKANPGRMRAVGS
jgi:hypothetical protein